VVAVIGDGGFQMTIQELGTIFQTKVPVKIVILNNEFLGYGASMATVVLISDMLLLR
jgi:thiamine pyrophosphate-dependent acetolactate synthase large subunit-like protein